MDEGKDMARKITDNFEFTPENKEKETSARRGRKENEHLLPERRVRDGRAGERCRSCVCMVTSEVAGVEFVVHDSEQQAKDHHEQEAC